MHPVRHRLSQISSALALSLLGAVWLFLAPMAVGGSAAYMMINGNSMEPHYHLGDLVIVRRAPAYGVGDIVTYRHPKIGPVIHRIVARDGDRFVFKGDNNSWLDDYKPTQPELIGKAWLYLPNAGKLIKQLQLPRNMAIGAALAGVLMIGTSGSARKPTRRQAARRSTSQRSSSMSQRSEMFESILSGLILLAVASIALAGFAFKQPLTQSVTDDVTFEQHGTFSYATPAPPGLYDTAVIRTGEPVFPQLTPSVDLAFTYQLGSERAGAVAGSGALTATLSSSNSWQRTIQLQPTTSFAGRTAQLSGTLDLRAVQALIDRFESETQLNNQQYMLTITPSISVTGELGGEPLSETFAPELSFRFERQQMQLIQKDSAAGAESVLKPVAAGTLPHKGTAAATLSLFGLHLLVERARMLGLLGAVVAALGLGVCLWWSRRGTAATQPDAQIRAKYGSIMVAASTAEEDALTSVVDVATIDDLARLANRMGCAILVVTEPSGTRYDVRDGSVTYRYRLAQAGAAPGAAAASERDWHSIFLSAIQANSTVAEACRAAGTTLTIAYSERERDAQFARSWKEAQSRARGSKRSTARSR